MLGSSRITIPVVTPDPNASSFESGRIGSQGHMSDVHIGALERYSQIRRICCAMDESRDCRFE